MTAPETTLQGKDRATTGILYMSVELSDKHWKLTLSDGSRSPSRCSIAAGDTAALLERVRKGQAALCDGGRCDGACMLRSGSRRLVVAPLAARARD